MVLFSVGEVLYTIFSYLFCVFLEPLLRIGMKLCAFLSYYFVRGLLDGPTQQFNSQKGFELLTQSIEKHHILYLSPLARNTLSATYKKLSRFIEKHKDFLARLNRRIEESKNQLFLKWGILKLTWREALFARTLSKEKSKKIDFLKKKYKTKRFVKNRLKAFVQYLVDRYSGKIDRSLKTLKEQKGDFLFSTPKDDTVIIVSDKQSKAPLSIIFNNKQETLSCKDLFK